MADMTVREIVLTQCNWPRRFLSPSGEIARLDYKTWIDWTPGLKPFRRWQRIRNPSAFLPIEEFFRIGVYIRFSSRLSDNWEFVGQLDPVADSSFPYDEWILTTPLPLYLQGGKILGFGLDHRGRTWVADYTVLTFLHDVVLRPPSH